MPFSLPSAAVLSAALTSSFVVFLETSNTTSTTETSGVGTRSDMPSSLPFSSGSTSDTALAAPVEVGMMDTAAARARAQVLVRQVEELLVVGVGVDRVHEAVHDAEILMDHLGDMAPGSSWCRRRSR